MYHPGAQRSQKLGRPRARAPTATSSRCCSRSRRRSLKVAATWTRSCCRTTRTITPARTRDDGDMEGERRGKLDTRPGCPRHAATRPSPSPPPLFEPFQPPPRPESALPFLAKIGELSSPRVVAPDHPAEASPGPPLGGHSKSGGPTRPRAPNAHGPNSATVQGPNSHSVSSGPSSHPHTSARDRLTGGTSGASASISSSGSTGSTGVGHGARPMSAQVPLSAPMVAPHHSGAATCRGLGPSSSPPGSNAAGIPETGVPWQLRRPTIWDVDRSQEKEKEKDKEVEKLKERDKELERARPSPPSQPRPQGSATPSGATPIMPSSINPTQAILHQIDVSYRFERPLSTPNAVASSTADTALAGRVAAAVASSATGDGGVTGGSSTPWGMITGDVAAASIGADASLSARSETGGEGARTGGATARNPSSGSSNNNKAMHHNSGDDTRTGRNSISHAGYAGPPTGDGSSSTSGPGGTARAGADASAAAPGSIPPSLIHVHAIGGLATPFWPQVPPRKPRAKSASPGSLMVSSSPAVVAAEAIASHSAASNNSYFAASLGQAAPSSAPSQPFSARPDAAELAQYSANLRQGVLPDSEIPARFQIFSHDPVFKGAAGKGEDSAELLRLADPSVAQRDPTQGAADEWRALQFPSKSPSGRLEVVCLARVLDLMCAEIIEKMPDKEAPQQAMGGRGAPEELAAVDLDASSYALWDVYSVVWKELVRQVWVHCVERGVLLERLRRGVADILSFLSSYAVAARLALGDLLRQLAEKKDALIGVTRDVSEKGVHIQSLECQVQVLEAMLEKERLRTAKQAEQLAEHAGRATTQQSRIDQLEMTSDALRDALADVLAQARGKGSTLAVPEAVRTILANAGAANTYEEDREAVERLRSFRNAQLVEALESARSSAAAWEALATTAMKQLALQAVERPVVMGAGVAGVGLGEAEVTAGRSGSSALGLKRTGRGGIERCEDGSTIDMGGAEEVDSRNAEEDTAASAARADGAPSGLPQPRPSFHLPNLRIKIDEDRTSATTSGSPSPSSATLRGPISGDSLRGGGGSGGLTDGLRHGLLVRVPRSTGSPRGRKEMGGTVSPSLLSPRSPGASPRFTMEDRELAAIPGETFLARLMRIKQLQESQMRRRRKGAPTTATGGGEQWSWGLIGGGVDRAPPVTGISVPLTVAVDVNGTCEITVSRLGPWQLPAGFRVHLLLLGRADLALVRGPDSFDLRDPASTKQIVAGLSGLDEATFVILVAVGEGHRDAASVQRVQTLLHSCGAKFWQQLGAAGRRAALQGEPEATGNAGVDADADTGADAGGAVSAGVAKDGKDGHVLPGGSINAPSGSSGGGTVGMSGMEALSSPGGDAAAATDGAPRDAPGTAIQGNGQGTAGAPGGGERGGQPSQGLLGGATGAEGTAGGPGAHPGRGLSSQADVSSKEPGGSAPSGMPASGGEDMGQVGAGEGQTTDKVQPDDKGLTQGHDQEGQPQGLNRQESLSGGIIPVHGDKSLTNMLPPAHFSPSSGDGHVSPSSASGVPSPAGAAAAVAPAGVPGGGEGASAATTSGAGEGEVTRSDGEGRKPSSAGGGNGAEGSNPGGANASAPSDSVRAVTAVSPETGTSGCHPGTVGAHKEGEGALNVKQGGVPLAADAAIKAEGMGANDAGPAATEKVEGAKDAGSDGEQDRAREQAGGQTGTSQPEAGKGAEGGKQESGGAVEPQKAPAEPSVGKPQDGGKEWDRSKAGQPQPQGVDGSKAGVVDGVPQTLAYSFIGFTGAPFAPESSVVGSGVQGWFVWDPSTRMYDVLTQPHASALAGVRALVEGAELVAPGMNSAQLALCLQCQLAQCMRPLERVFQRYCLMLDSTGQVTSHPFHCDLRQFEMLCKGSRLKLKSSEMAQLYSDPRPTPNATTGGDGSSNNSSPASFELSSSPRKGGVGAKNSSNLSNLSNLSASSGEGALMPGYQAPPEMDFIGFLESLARLAVFRFAMSAGKLGTVSVLQQGSSATAGAASTAATSAANETSLTASLTSGGGSGAGSSGGGAATSTATTIPEHLAEVLHKHVLRYAAAMRHPRNFFRELGDDNVQAMLRIPYASFLRKFFMYARTLGANPGRADSDDEGSRSGTPRADARNKPHPGKYNSSNNDNNNDSPKEPNRPELSISRRGQRARSLDGTASKDKELDAAVEAAMASKKARSSGRGVTYSAWLRLCDVCEITSMDTSRHAHDGWAGHVMAPDTAAQVFVEVLTEDDTDPILRQLKARSEANPPLQRQSISTRQGSTDSANSTGVSINESGRGDSGGVGNGSSVGGSRGTLWRAGLDQLRRVQWEPSLDLESFSSALARCADLLFHDEGEGFESLEAKIQLLMTKKLLPMVSILPSFPAV
eukprot:jgi/Mesvir1/29698/Mv00932-RA.1